MIRRSFLIANVRKSCVSGKVPISGTCGYVGWERYADSLPLGYISVHQKCHLKSCQHDLFVHEFARYSPELLPRAVIWLSSISFDPGSCLRRFQCVLHKKLLNKVTNCELNIRGVHTLCSRAFASSSVFCAGLLYLVKQNDKNCKIGVSFSGSLSYPDFVPSPFNFFKIARYFG